MTQALNAAPPSSERFPNRLRAFRERLGASQAQLSESLGVSKVTVLRWENGSAKPSQLAAAKLVELGFEGLRPEDTNLDEIPRSQRAGEPGLWGDEPAEPVEQESWTVRLRNAELPIEPAPYVLNGPPNQVPFHRTLIELQQQKGAVPFDKATFADRLSLVARLEGCAPTSQFRLERPKQTASHWNPNYGSHGWHRYIGRFPPHLVRALLNHFGANKETVVLDPFSGSGTTLVECRLLGIPAVGVELCPLSALMSRVKARFEPSGRFYDELARKVLRLEESSGSVPETATEVTRRKGALLPSFSNCDKWLTAEAAHGIDAVLRMAGKLPDEKRDAVLLALSAKMRSIGNVDVDVARAEYRKTPRTDVDVFGLVGSALKKMAKDAEASAATHANSLGAIGSISVIEQNVLDAKLDPGSIDHVVTSPPYGVESSSYLRSHLLSYRCLHPFLKIDPYDFGHKAIGSEYFSDKLDTNPNHGPGQASPTFSDFFKRFDDSTLPNGLVKRAHMMTQFFADMERLGDKLHKAMKKGGSLALVVGNKRIGDHVIPTELILSELYEHLGFTRYDTIAQKLKCNNSNSQVPWQEKIIQDEFVLLFRKA